MVEVLHVILETTCVLIARTFFQILLNMFFFEILIPKVKPNIVAIFYRTPNVHDFLNTFSNDFDNKTN